MTAQHIEKLQREYTDKYVVVDDEQPEFARFKGLVGRVKTVNMGGCALVEFLDYHLNIGWYDIDVDFLKVVDKPKPKEKAPAKKPAPKKLAAKKAPAGEKKLSPLEMARAADSKKKEQAADTKVDKTAAKPAGEKLSTADILAAARGKGLAAARGKGLAAARGKGLAAAPGKGLSAARGNGSTTSAKPAAEERPAAPVAKASPPAGGRKLDRSKMSVADMLAAARGDKLGDAAAPAEEETPDALETADQPLAEEETARTVESPAASSGASGPVDKSAMSVDDILAWCREHDG